MPQLRVLSYNVRHLRDDPMAIARVVQVLAPDVLCVQEGPRGPRWRAHVAALARSTGLLVVSGGPSAGSNLLLSSLRVQVREVLDVHFPVHHALAPRGAAVARLRVGGSEVVLASTHLSLHATERLDNVATLTAYLHRRAEGSRLVVAGDLNETPDGPAWQAFAQAGLHDGWAQRPVGGEMTFSARAPRRRIDAVLTSPGVEVVGCGVPDDTAVQRDLALATDHLPLLADLRLA